MLHTVLLAFHILLALALIGIILIQQGRGAAAGAAFGGGASSTVFGSRGSASFLTRATTIMAVVFFVNCMVLAYLSSHQPESRSLVEQVVEQNAAAAANSLEVSVTGEGDEAEGLETAIQKVIDAAQEEGGAAPSADVPVIPD